MRTARTAAALSALCSLAAAPLALAAGGPSLTLTDPAGDANMINGQGVPGVGAGSYSGPAQHDAADILSITFAREGSAKGAGCKGFTARVEFAAPPTADNTLYRILGAGTANQEFWLEHDMTAFGVETLLRTKNGDETVLTPLTAAKVDGKALIFTVTAADLRRVGENPAAFRLFDPGADVRVSVDKYTVPMWDGIDRDAAASFAPCR